MTVFSNESNNKLYTEENMKNTKTAPVKQLILTALIAGFGMAFAPVVLAQPMPNHQGQKHQAYQNDQGGEDHEDHKGHQGHQCH